jgi:bifunctional non-homologous end joining protein LigD
VSAAVRSARVETRIGDRKVTLSNLDKVMYPAAGFTKGDVIDYYARVSAWLLPHVRLRPLTLRRFPDGVDGRSRFEKCCPERRPEWFPVVPVYVRSRGSEKPFCTVDDLASLIWLANQANLELHPMLCRAEDLDRPTAVAFDLDPGPERTLIDCADVALVLRGMLERVGLQSWVKSSGGKGLHVMVPLNTPVTFAQTRAFARTVAELMAARMPDLVTSAISQAERGGRVLIDWGQNAQHKSIVAVYSLRAQTSPTVSMPVTWAKLIEVAGKRRADGVAPDPAYALERLERDGDLFEPLLSRRQELPRH